MESNDRLLKSPAPSTSYFSLTIWKTGTAPSTSPYNAGNNDPEVGSHILRFLQVYWQRLTRRRRKDNPSQALGVYPKGCVENESIRNIQ